MIAYKFRTFLHCLVQLLSRSFIVLMQPYRVSDILPVLPGAKLRRISTEEVTVHNANGVRVQMALGLRSTSNSTATMTPHPRLIQIWHSP